MLDLFGRGMATEGIGVAYLMPTAFVLAGYPEEQRRVHLKPMFEGLMTLNQEKRDIVMKTQREAMTVFIRRGSL